MGLLDREWFAEDHARREKEYGGDFSLNSKKVNNKSMQQLSPIEAEILRIRKERANKNKAAIAIGALTLLLAAACFFSGIKAGTLLPLAVGILNGYMCVQAEKRQKKEADNTSLNQWARTLTMLAVLAMIGIAVR